MTDGSSFPRGAALGFSWVSRSGEYSSIKMHKGFPMRDDAALYCFCSMKVTSCSSLPAASAYATVFLSCISRCESEVATIPHKNSETALIFHPFHQQSSVVGVLGECSEGKLSFGHNIAL